MMTQATKLPQVKAGRVLPAADFAPMNHPIVRRALELAEKHAQPAHDEEAYYNPPSRQDPWEGMGYFWFALTAGVAGWLFAYLLGV